ncbi:hypothetical protein PN492_13600 [Dolichospermum circinale CS-537/01]|uniref:Uncharacterized protein n=1 Tax=Dolichospermum circinale CS-537/01 TaxID=3021739 RepID=A0ABT5A6J9_9CYAN|nr:hypothetical protein [Dolichospermum circinale]MDB9487570.1 hypothetical protein [Dolichospermum circinale CS-537/01]
MLINFAGINGKVITSSPHGNYLVVQLNNRITITGTYSNQFNWEENNEFESGFKSFLTYIGIKNDNELDKYHQWIEENNGYFHYKDEVFRVSKRIKGFPYEIKVRGLSVESVIDLINFK